MNTGLLKVVEEMSRDVLLLAQSVLDDSSVGTNAKTNKNTLRVSTLRQNIRSSIEASDNVILTIYFDNYIHYIEQGRAPMSGKRPPLSAIRDWALKKGLPTNDGTLYAITQAIWRDGYAGRPVLATLEQRISESFDNKWADKLFEAITIELTKYFN